MLYLQNKGFRLLEALVITLIATVGLCFLFEIILSQPPFLSVMRGFGPSSEIVRNPAMLYIAAALGHIYMGTIGVEHTYGNMRHGYTDETWAKEHHEIWYREVKSGQRQAAGGAVPAGAPHKEEDA